MNKANDGQDGRPFLRWMGGKRALVADIVREMPPQFGRYYEPFLGSGAVFFGLSPGRATLSDQNSDLVCAFRVVRDDLEALLTWLRARDEQSASAYYAMRRYKPRSDLGRAGRLIYLNRTAFNGVWRVNRQGEFNVPYGHRHRQDFIREGDLRRASRALRGVTLSVGDFESTTGRVRPRDLVYLDPPYTVRHMSNGFHRYNDVLFSWLDQERLAAVATRLVRRGATVIVSNSPHEDIDSLYDASLFERRLFWREARIAASVEARGAFLESVLVGRGRK